MKCSDIHSMLAVYSFFFFLKKTQAA
jgi:hypothetical protein